jgi:hypothetical protein
MDFYKLVRHKLQTARTFSWNEWKILARAWVLLLVIDWGLRLVPFRRVKSLVNLQGASTEVAHANDVLGTIQRSQKLVDVAARNHLYPMRCLRQALVLQRMLGQQGIATELRFGVQKDSGGLNAHAWLEHKGQPIGEPQSIALRFAPLAVTQADQ